MTPPVSQPAYHYFKVSGKLVKVQRADRLFVQSLKDYLVLHTRQEKLMVHMTMTFLEEMLPMENFLRIHRSFLVNKNFVTAVGKRGISIGEVQLPVGGSYRKNLSSII